MVGETIILVRLMNPSIAGTACSNAHADIVTKVSLSLSFLQGSIPNIKKERKRKEIANKGNKFEAPSGLKEMGLSSPMDNNLEGWNILKSSVFCLRIIKSGLHFRF